eukprot:m.21985 g.21985  ORF g.21985 m.21985 type:complete len:99 (-) comp9133_c0_seq1:93-389(-)
MKERPQPAYQAPTGPLAFPRWEKFVRRGTWVAVTVTAGYLLLFHDFGEGEHCFSPIRRYMNKHVAQYWTPTEEETKRIAAIAAAKAPSTPSTASPSKQ